MNSQLATSHVPALSPSGASNGNFIIHPLHKHLLPGPHHSPQPHKFNLIPSKSHLTLLPCEPGLCIHSKFYVISLLVDRYYPPSKMHLQPHPSQFHSGSLALASHRLYICLPRCQRRFTSPTPLHASKIRSYNSYPTKSPFVLFSCCPQRNLWFQNSLHKRRFLYSNSVGLCKMFHRQRNVSPLSVCWKC